MQRKGAKEREADVLAYWEREAIFERSVQERPTEDPYVFVDGPPFATGLPHYGHLVASTMKDVIPRFWTMRGKRVERVWGWDCHGLPIENIIEKDLDLGDRQKIEAFGIQQFNEACRSRVLEYADGWQQVIRRLGRWVDMKEPYSTMDPAYMESVWWAFKELWSRGHLYEGYRPIHICPRCATTLSASEVGSEYRDITDLSVVMRFVRKDDPTVALLAWTTTPWTLPANTLLAVGPGMTYVKVKQHNGYLILAEEAVERVLEGEYEVVEKLQASDLIGMEYTPPFPYFAQTSGAFRVVAADFVNAQEGTGIVHIAPGFGEDDYAVGQREQVEVIQHVAIDGRFVEAVTDFAGEQAKPSDAEIVKYLASRGLVYTTKHIRHSYPHCWRCDTPLLNYATTSWFIRVSEERDALLATNEKTHWVPTSVKEGRFGRWLESARDWSVSRNRYWGTPLPVWKAEDGDVLVVGSIQELETLSGVTVTDLHKHIVDAVVIEHEGKTYRRIPEVLDCWFESGSGPFARLHYPFENADAFTKGHPAQFIAEGQDQTRGWFYALHVLSTLLFGVPAFEHVIVNGLVMAEDGKKMSKKLQNYPDPMTLLDTYGADAVRLYMMSSPVVHMENLNFKESGVKEVSNKFVGTLANVLSFYQLFVTGVPREVSLEELHPLDRWILALLGQTRNDMTRAMEAYDLASAARALQQFVTELSQWYVRRSRDRFKQASDEEQVVASRVLYRVLETVARLSAPFTPFLAEHVWQELHGASRDSVHLAPWPLETDLDELDTSVLETMNNVRALVTKTLDQRAAANVSVRQVLGRLKVSSPEPIDEAYLTLIQEEVNVQEISWVQGELAVELDTQLTPALRQLGFVRELTRQGNALRKQAGLAIEDTIVLYWESDDEDVVQAFACCAGDIAERVKAVQVERGLNEVQARLQFETEEGIVDLGLSRV